MFNMRYFAYLFILIFVSAFAPRDGLILTVIFAAVFLIALEVITRYETGKKFQKLKELLEENSIEAILLEKYETNENKRIIEDILGLVSKLKMREERLTYENEYIKNVIEVMDGGFVTVSESKKIIYVNNLFCELVNISKEEILNKKIEEIEILEKIFNKIEKSGEDFTGETDFESRIFNYRHQKLSGNLKDEVLFIRDITEEKQFKDILLETKKIVALRDFASGVAHEIRNPLTPVKGLLQVIKTKVPEENKETFTKYIDIIFKELDRLDSRIEKLDKFAEEDKYTMKTVELDNFLKNIVNELESQDYYLQKNITLNTKFDLKDVNVKVNSERFKEAILCIMKNSCEAIENQGKIFISSYWTKNKKVIQISDDGKGIEQEKLKNINNPFYTTKIEKQAIGLGLPMAYKILNNHGGNISIDSEVGKGTMVKIIFG